MSGITEKSVRVHVKNVDVTESQLAKIRTHTLREFSADELMVREFVLAHNAIDRDRDVFSSGILADFARTLPGKGIHIRHPSARDGDSGPGEGKIFDARIERMTHEAARQLLKEPALQWPHDHPEAELLFVQGYYVRTPENVSFLLKVEAGIAGEVSVGFSGGDINRIKGQDGIELNVWRWDAPAEGREMSHVWLGAQPGARAIKNAQKHAKEPEMTPEQIKALNEENARLKAAAEATEKAAATVDAIKSALGENATLLDRPGDLAAAVNAGAEYRKGLVASIVAGERHAGICGDSEGDVKAATELYNALPTDKLKAMAARYEEKAAPPAGGVTPSPPGKHAPGSTTKAAPDGSPINNPALA